MTAFSGFVAVGVPIDPGTQERKVHAWTRAHVASVLELYAALGELIATRRTYDRIRPR